MAALLQAAKEQAMYQSQQRVIGPAFAGALKQFGPPSTTSAFLTYFRSGMKGMKSFVTKDIPSLFQAPFSQGKIFAWAIIIVVLICVFIYLQNLNKPKTKETFQDTSIQSHQSNQSNQSQQSIKDTELTKLINISIILKIDLLINLLKL